MISKKMKKILYILFVTIPFVAKAQEKGILFINDKNWQEIKKIARDENKFIFIDCFASWCGPCKAMEKDVYSDEKVANYFNNKFINLKVQMDITPKDDDHVKQWYVDAKVIGQLYKINAYPCFLFFSPDGEIVHKGLGLQSVDDFLRLAANAMDPENQYYTLLKQYQSDKLDTGSMKSFARMARSLGETELSENVAKSYIDKLDGNELYTKDNISFLYDFTKSTKDRGFGIIRDNIPKIHQIENNWDEANSKVFLEIIIYNEEIKPFEKSHDGKPDWNEMVKNIQKFGVLGNATFDIYKPDIIFRIEILPFLKTGTNWVNILPAIKKMHTGKGEEFLVGSTVVYFCNNIISGTQKNCGNFISAATYYSKNFASYLKPDPQNSWAWIVFQHSSDKIELTKALEWSHNAVEMTNQADGAYLDTYANLLYKLGRIKEAITWEGKALEISHNDQAIANALIKMKNGAPTWDHN